MPAGAAPAQPPATSPKAPTAASALPDPPTMPATRRLASWRAGGWTWRGQFSGLATLELAATVEGLTHERRFALDDGADPVWLDLIDQHLDAVLGEMGRRLANHTAGRGPNPRAGWIARAGDIAAEVRRRADITLPLVLAGWQPTRRAARGQLNGPCPVCGEGHDRFVVFPATAGRDARVWCRRCGYSQDAIGLYRDLRGVPFATALYDLAATCPGIDLLALNLTPDELRQVDGAARQARRATMPVGRPAGRPGTVDRSDRIDQMRGSA